MSLETPQLAEPSIDVPPTTARGPITFRAIALGLLLTVFIAILAPYSDYVRHNTFLIGNQLPIVLVAVLTILCVVVNPILGPRRLRPSELAVAIGMMFISCALPTSGFFRFFHSLLGASVYHARNWGWFNQYLALLPDWMVPSKDPTSPPIDHLYQGLPARGGEGLAGTWRAWLVPYAAWLFFVVPFFGAVLFLCALFRKQWVAHERLAYPLATIPMEMMAEPELGRRLSPLWRNHLLWIGAAIPFVIHLVNGLALFYPSIPTITIRYNLYQTFTEFPWNQFPNEIKGCTIYFSVIGAAFFVPLEVAFSIWFFFIAYAVGAIFFKRSGMDVSNDHQVYQSYGAGVTYGLFLFYIARHHFAHVARNLFKPREPDEYLPYWMSVGGLLVCVLIASGFLAAAGMTWWLTTPVFLWLLFWAMIVTRVVIEAGILCPQLPAAMEPVRFLGYLLQGVTQGLTPTWMRNWLLTSWTLKLGLVDQRETLMPFAADSLRLAETVEAPARRRFFAMLVLALAVCFLASGATHHILSYQHGRENFDVNGYNQRIYPKNAMDQAREWADPGSVPNKIHRGWNFAYGAIAMAIVSGLRALLPNSPLHPIGLVVLNGWATRMMWFSIFLAWLIKFVILRWGGAKVFQQARPFFIGLIVGESLAGVLWALVGLWASWPDPAKPYQLLPA